MRSFLTTTAVIFSALAFSTSAFAQASPGVGVTSVAIGDPLSRPPQLNERVLRIGVDVFANERITTQADDRAHLMFLDGSAVTIGPNSDLSIDRFVYDPVKRDGDLNLSMTKGTMRFVGGALSKKKHVTITSPSATIGIRGGIMTVNITDSTTTVAFLFGHSAEVTNRFGAQTAQRIGSQITVPKGGAPNAPIMLPPGAMVNVMAALEGNASTNSSKPPAIVNNQHLNKLADMYANNTVPGGNPNGPPAQANNGGNGNGNGNGNANGNGNGRARRIYAAAPLQANGHHSFLKHQGVSAGGSGFAPVGSGPGNGNAFGAGVGGGTNFAGGSIGTGPSITPGIGNGIANGINNGNGNAGGNGNGNGHGRR